MKKIAILVIAATNQPVYIHYLKTYWSELIKYTNAEKPNIDVFLLFEHGTVLPELEYLENNIIQDQDIDFSLLCDPEYQALAIPGILSKTIYALEQLQDQYDVFFRTNLSSVIKIPAFELFVQNKAEICYSGAFVWVDALRQDLLYHNKIGADKSIKSLSELDQYQGNTFISGSSYFLNAAEAKSLVKRKRDIRYDIIDDVSVGLMFSRHEVLPGFSLIVSPGSSVADSISAIQQSNASHIRLEHFPLEHAQALWQELKTSDIWGMNKSKRQTEEALANNMNCYEGHLGGYIMSSKEPAPSGLNIENGDPATWTPELWSWIQHKFEVRSMIDVGCGEGHCAGFFAKHGCEVLGVDGSQRAAYDSVIPDAHVIHDFVTAPYVPLKRYDLVWSCEFVEHVDERYADNFLSVFSKADKCVAMTYASPGQPGWHHVNCQPETYWIEKLSKLGFILDEALTQEARRVARGHFKHKGLLFRPANNTRL